MRQHNLRVTGSLSINGENVISASELSALSSSIVSRIEGLNPSQIGTGSYTASISSTGGFNINTTTTITGSLLVSNLSGSGVNYISAVSGGLLVAVSGSNAILNTERFIATAGQTVFNSSYGYLTGLVQVYYNGTKLDSTEFSDINGSTITLTTGSNQTGDIVELVTYRPVSGVEQNALRTKTSFTASVSQTTFAVQYTPGLIDVYFNGSHLASEEYTANNGTTIVLTEAATGGEVVDVFVYNNQIGAFSGIGGGGEAGQFAYFSSQSGISGSSVISISGSNIIAGGSIIPSTSGSYDLGSSTKPFRHIYVGTGSIYLVDNQGQVTNTISAQTIVTTDTLASGTIDLTDSLPAGTVSSSTQVVGILSALNQFTASNDNTSLNSKTGSYATTGSNTFFGTQTYSGSVYIANDLIVQGSSSIQYITGSSVNIGTNIVQLNTANPSVRYAGLSIVDSGSVGGSGSFLYDSVQDEFIFVHRGDGTNVTSSHFVLGPETYNSLGNETYLTSNIQDVSGSVTIGGTLCTSGIICSSNLEIKQSSNNRLIIDCVNVSNEPRISSLDSANNPQYLTINSYDLKIKTNCGEALRINDTKQFIVGATSMAYANTIGYVAGFMSDFTGQSVVSIARKGQTLASQGMFIGIDSTSSYFWNRDNVAIQLGTNDTTKMTIACTGQAIFACSVCAPQYITTQGSSVSYASGTNYTIWNSEAESCIQDSNNPAAYTRIKTWIADRSGCATIRYTGYIQSGPTYWGYRVTRNGTSSYMCVAWDQCIQTGCPSANVHGYSSYQFNVGPFLPGDCIGLDVVSTGGGATPSVGQGQWIFAKEFRVFSTTPNLSAGTSGNVFGEWVGIGTCTPFSNLYINGSNPALYDASVDNGQDGCGVTLTVRNNSIVTNSFAQLNLQTSGDSGRAIGRIALIRRDSATADMAFVTECGNTKSEKMRIYAGGPVTKPLQPFVYGGLASDQTISTSNPTKVNFVANVGWFGCNVGGYWNNSTNQLTAPVTGVYLVNISGYWSATNLINQFAAFVNSNRKVSIPTGYCTNIAGGSMMVPMAAGETLDFRVYNDVATGTLYQNVYHTFFSIYLLG
jgi:hypothetical protein